MHRAITRCTARLLHPKPRWASNSSKESTATANKRLGIYAAGTVVVVIGVSYAAVPLYQMFCQATGYGGTLQTGNEADAWKDVRPVEGAKPVIVYFNADTSDSMPWKFVPLQRSVKVVPGEHALAFYRAVNPTDKPITGVSTYNVTPMRVGVYFHKIQCFCFEEQRLGPKEEVDMPLLFYIDPEFATDPAMKNIRSITLSYTFFKTNSPEEKQ